jgi:hypothetical protein
MRPAQIATQFDITPCRVRQIVASNQSLRERLAQLKREYGPRPSIESLPDETPIDVLILCEATIHGWWTRVSHLAFTSLELRTLGDLRRTSDAQLLAEPKIGKRTVEQLRLFCPRRSSPTSENRRVH